MKITALLTVTNPDERQDPWRECLASVEPWADEIVVVNGGKELDVPSEKVKQVMYPWPYEWSWEELPKHLNRGLEEATGDWVIRVDADYVFAEEVREVKTVLSGLEGSEVATFQKFSSVLINKWYQKGAMVMALNRKSYPNLWFGKAETYTDLCKPILKEREENGIPIGVLPTRVGKTRFSVYTYDYAFKTKEFTGKEFLRFSLAHKKHFGYTQWGETEEDSLHVFLQMMRGRLAKCVYDFKVEDHPIYIRERVRSIKPEEFAHSGWGSI